jgi:Fur family transcriptional regulator, ferric uptake regulator
LAKLPDAKNCWQVWLLASMNQRAVAKSDLSYNENEIQFHLPIRQGVRANLAMLQKRIDDHAPPTREAVREAQEIFFKHLKRVGLKHTEQRDTILRTFLDTRDHLSTDELFRLVRKKDTKIGFTTVYRTLKLLAECGLASEVAFHDGVARYEHQFNRRSHHHMVCTDCGASVEFFSPEAGKLQEDIARKHRFDATRHTFQIYGICEDCRKRTTGKKII